MTNWTTEIDFTEFWDNDYPIEEIAQKAAGKVRELGIKIGGILALGHKSFSDDDLSELEDLAFEFENVESVEGFDWVMEDLYNWADELTLDNIGGFGNSNKKCWVKTML